ncbi:MAG TPA: hypothetical protein PKL31_16730 [Fulvivirga sp.]|nr:hypothetical protein [Fulvivirga sp.]
MATITMYLKHDNDLLYSMDNVKFQPLEVDTVTGVNAGDTMRWELARDSNIIKINNINVNEDKNGRKSTDIWQVKPKSTDGGQTMQGIVDPSLDEKPKYNGYTIKYKTADGDKEKDPDLLQPRPPGEGGN